MSEEQKEPYKKKYADWKGQTRNDYMETLSVTSDSSSYSNIFDPKKQQYDFNELFDSLKLKVEKSHKIKDYNLQGEHVCRNQRWFVIKFQTFCKCESFVYENREYTPYYVLAEISIVEFCLKNGIIREYHSFIKPNRIPIGYRSKCMDTSRDFHEIPLEHFEQAHYKEYHEIYRDIIDFIRANEEEKDYADQYLPPLPVFCLQDDLEETKFALDFLKDCYRYHYSKQQPREVTIFRLELLITMLTNQVDKRVSFQAAHDLLTQYTYDYVPETRCHFHECVKNNINCSLGIVKKFCFLISDAICPFYDINLSERHIPKLKPSGVLVRNDTLNPRSVFKPDSRKIMRRNQYLENGSTTENSETGFDEDPEEFPDSSDTRSNISESSSTTIVSYPDTSTLTTVTSSFKTNTLSGIGSVRTTASSTRVLVSQKFESSLSGSTATYSNRAQKSIFSDDSSTIRTATTLTKTETNTYCSDKNNTDIDDRSTSVSYASNRNNQAMSKEEDDENDFEDDFEDNDWSDNYSHPVLKMKNLKIDANNNENDDLFSEKSDQSFGGHSSRGTNASRKIFFGRGKLLSGKK